MACFAGLDIGLDKTAVCIVDGDGGIVREGKVATEPEALAGFLAEAGVPLERVGLEACPLSQWLFRELADAGLPVVCLELRHLKAALSAMTHKTDRNDARGIAQVVRTGWFRTVHVKSTLSQEQRMLLAGRRLLVGQRVALESELRGSLKVFGLKVGPTTAKGFAERVLALAEDRPALLLVVQPLLGLRAELVRRIAELHRLVLDHVRRDQACRRWMTIPGVGPLTALTFRSAIDAPERFVKSRAVGAHLGLVPRKHQSGQVDRNGRITKCGDGLARTALYEAAHVLMARGRPCGLKAWAQRLAARRGFKRARTALARRLAVTMHAMWEDGTEFRRGGEVAATRAG